MIEGLRPDGVIADRAYDSDDLRKTIRKSGGRPVIPSRRGTRVRRYSKTLYKLRNQIERFFGRLKHYRRLATRYDKTDESYSAFLALATGLLNNG